MSICTPKRAFWALLFINFIWGSSYVVVDIAIDSISVNSFNALRFLIATLALIPLWYIHSKSSSVSLEYKFSSLFKTGGILGLLLFGGYYLQTQGMLYTSVSNAGFITGMIVPLVPIVDLIIYKTKVSTNIWVGVFITVIGLYFLTIGDKLILNSGDILVALAAVCFSVQIAMVAKAVKEFPIIALCTIQLGAIALYSGLIAIIETMLELNSAYPPLLEVLTDFKILAAILYAGVLASAFAFWVQSSSQKLLEPHKIAMVIATQPIFAFITAFLVLGEVLNFSGMVGASLIILGMLYAELSTKKVPLPPIAEPIESIAEHIPTGIEL